MSLFAILAIGADEAAGSATDFGKTYIEAAYSLYGQLVANPYLASVQALILLGFSLRGKSKDGQCWQLTGQAIRIAHSIGLHRHLLSGSRHASHHVKTPASHHTSPDSLSLEARVWWSCYAIERVMELETGRPSALTEQEIDQLTLSHPQHSEGDSLLGPMHLFLLWISLARIIGQISEHLYRRRTANSWQLLYETGRLDQLLLEWVTVVPEGMKPGHEMVHLGSDEQDTESGHQHQHIAAFLSLQYYQAQITLLRASLAFPTQKYLEETKRKNAEKRLPSYHRLLQSQNLSIAAARSMAHQVLEIADHGITSKHLFGPTQPFLAAVVLGLHILKSPGKRMTRSDVELMVGITEYIEIFYRKTGQSTEFVKGCETLRSSVLEAVAMEGQNTTLSRKDKTVIEPGRSSSKEIPHPAGMDIQMSNVEPLLVAGQGPAFLEPYGGISLEQFWTTMNSDFIMEQPLDFDGPMQ